jgi:hypothetical protein
MAPAGVGFPYACAAVLLPSHLCMLGRALMGTAAAVFGAMRDILRQPVVKKPPSWQVSQQSWRIIPISMYVRRCCLPCMMVHAPCGPLWLLRVWPLPSCT